MPNDEGISWVFAFICLQGLTELLVFSKILRAIVLLIFCELNGIL
jgi:hypothetical protein